jgi:hypothetical protein
MTLSVDSRREALAYLTRQNISIPTIPKDKFFDKYCSAIQRGKFIPIIGDTIRTAHIFDIDNDNDIGMALAHSQPDKLERSVVGRGQLDEIEKEETYEIDWRKFNVTEELAYRWGKSESVNYPLKDGFQIARVAQYHTLAQQYRVAAKEGYLDFLKKTLMREAYQIEQAAGNEEEMAFITELFIEKTLSFSHLVHELDFPRFENGKEDPLKILAHLPLNIYLTTSYHNFLERELEAADKRPRTRLCFWNIGPDDVAAQFQSSPDDRPSVEEPIVYHLLGLEQYPESMVLSEDDYLNLLWAIARNEPGSSHRGGGIIPSYLEAELRDASLLLLGYRLEDWDLRVLFWGMLRSRQEVRQPRWPSAAIQLDLAEQPLIQDEIQAEEYLKKYFNQIKLDVRFGDSDDFVFQLGEEWKRFRGTNNND